MRTKIYLMGTQEVRALAGVTVSFKRGSFWAIMGTKWFGEKHHDEHPWLPGSLDQRFVLSGR